jgi:hypothetical protein
VADLSNEETRYTNPVRPPKIWPTNAQKLTTAFTVCHGLAAAQQHSQGATVPLAGPQIRPMANRSRAATSLPVGDVMPTTMAGPSAVDVGDGKERNLVVVDENHLISRANIYFFYYNVLCIKTYNPNK